MSEVYRTPLSPLEQIQVTPAWPDFVILMDQDRWYAVTNAGRPKLPYFWRPLSAPETASDEYLLRIGRQELDAVYAEAHPHGCPKVGH